MISMTIMPMSGISSDGFTVIIEDEGNERCLFNENYRYGWDASYSRENADAAHADAEKAKKYGWTSSHYREKPFVSDIPTSLVAERKDIEQIYVFAGQNKFKGEPVSEKTVNSFIEEYITPVDELRSLLYVA